MLAYRFNCWIVILSLWAKHDLIKSTSFCDSLFSKIKMVQRGTSPPLTFLAASKRLVLRPGDTPEIIVSSLEVVENFKDDEVFERVVSITEDTGPRGLLTRDQLAALDAPPASLLSDLDMADLSISIETPSVQISNVVSFDTEEDQGVLDTMKRNKYAYFDC